MNKKYVYLFVVTISTIITSCKVPAIVQIQNTQALQPTFNNVKDTANTAAIRWNSYFKDPALLALIDTALKNNYELLKTMQNIKIASNGIQRQQANLFPTVNGAIGLGLEKTGRYTASGAGNASTEILPGKEVPEPIGDMFYGFRASWEIDVWGKLHNAKKAAVLKYLQSIEGRNFLITNLVAEVASAYYELLALDNQLDIVKQAIDLQKSELEVLKIQKEAAKATELGVKQFEALVYNSQAQEFGILQNITETENKINFLLGRFPQPVVRDKASFALPIATNIQVGIPAQLLQNRPDIKQAELELQISKLDVQIARAEFLPSVGITGMLGLQGFKPKYVVPNIENLAFNLIGDLVAPLVNRNAIKAEFKTASANQINALYEYQSTVLNAYIDVYNQMSNISNLQKYYALKNNEAQTLAISIDVAKDLFKSARANYLEVLTVQRDALSARLELVEAKKNQLLATTNIYKALGGGWK